MSKISKLFLFDIDGTLLHTGGAGKIAIERAFEKLFGISKAYQNMDPHGKTDPIIFEELANLHLNRSLTAEEHYSLFDLYPQYFRESIATFPEPYQLEVGEVKRWIFRILPGIFPLLNHLQEQEHCLLGLQTGNFEETAWMKLEKAGLSEYFKFGGFGSDATNRDELVQVAVERGRALARKEIQNQDVFLIGDSVKDIKSGRAAEITTIGVATGNTSRNDLEAAGANLVLDHLADLEYFIKYTQNNQAN